MKSTFEPLGSENNAPRSIQSCIVARVGSAKLTAAFRITKCGEKVAASETEEGWYEARSL